MEEIKRSIKQEFELFEANFKAAFRSQNALLEQINNYILQKNGKHLRPTIVLLAAKLCAERCSGATIDSAVALELLHTASLLHDDIVDNTLERRGRPSINAQWNNKIAVLAGDFFLSNALCYAARTDNLEIMRLLAQIGINLSEGELFQLEKENSHHITEEDYLLIIRKKTALLFASCAKMGALSVGTDAHKTLKMSLFGEYLGTCFQIKDDIFDYSDNKNIGKPTGNDVREGKITLPLIFALKNATQTEKQQIISLLKKNDLDSNSVQKIIRFVCQKNGLELAAEKMQQFKSCALAELAAFPESEAKNALVACAEFAAARNY